MYKGHSFVAVKTHYKTPHLTTELGEETGKKAAARARAMAEGKNLGGSPKPKECTYVRTPCPLTAKFSPHLPSPLPLSPSVRDAGD